MRKIEGEFNARGKSFAIVAARWNEAFSERLLEGAINCILKYNGDEQEITVVRVPGSFEIPLACKHLAKSKNFDAIIAVGALIKGETDHYRLIADQLSAGLMNVSLETGTPVTFGVITADNTALALARAGEGEDNKGHEAAAAAIEMASMLTKIGEK